jgi:hypothetical protein
VEKGAIFGIGGLSGEDVGGGEAKLDGFVEFLRGGQVYSEF